MGYDVKDKALLVNPGEASAIRTIFAEYLAAGTVRKLSARLDELGVVSKRRTDRHGRTSGGTAFSRGALYNILRNPIYIGKVRHKNVLHGGLWTSQRPFLKVASHRSSPRNPCAAFRISRWTGMTSARFWASRILEPVLKRAKTSPANTPLRLCPKLR